MKAWLGQKFTSRFTNISSDKQDLKICIFAVRVYWFTSCIIMPIYKNEISQSVVYGLAANKIHSSRSHKFIAYRLRVQVAITEIKLNIKRRHSRICTVRVPRIDSFKNSWRSVRCSDFGGLSPRQLTIRMPYEQWVGSRKILFACPR